MAFAGSSDGQSGSARAHFVLVPMMAQGHTIPMTDMARLLAEHGAQVSFITTPVNAARLEGFAAEVEAAGLAVQLVELHFPSVEFGLPDGCENLDVYVIIKGGRTDNRALEQSWTTGFAKLWALELLLVPPFATAVHS
ncbi:hypothetical protein VPH35_050611 [Triticum aestivum]|uniref:Glycosyltransferase n=2 Tax=Triticum TaxID=4564 RepID=A0A9R1RY90_TRITD|nr:UDP-glycosyltransferase 73C4-like [Triticum aestivum]VAH73998.1 unnamed protein product [Triticum turgidum subsp. durum]